jgi:hypothetical protein
VYGPLPASTYDAHFDGATRWVFAVRVAVNPADTGRAQTGIDTYLDASGSNSIRAAVLADVTLGGAADSVRVVGVDEAPHLGDQYGSQLLLASVRVEVYAAS